jgi:outer membrane receptor for ferrienterochelin and colicins
MKFLYILAFLPFGFVNAQEYSFSGKIIDATNKESIAGAIIRIKDIDKVYVSNLSGNFKITGQQKGNLQLTVSYVGFESHDLQISLPTKTDSVYTIALRPSIVDMDGVVVTGTRTEKKLKDMPVLTQVIYPENLKENGITSITDALEHEIPGLDFNNEQTPLRPTLTFQGLSSNYVLILMDGERIAGETNGDIDYSMLNLNNVDRIEVVKGASSVLYGSNAIGGVINIITKKPSVPFDLSAYSRYTKYNELESGITLSVKQSIFSSQTGIAYNQTDGYHIPTSDWTQYKSQNTSLSEKIGIDISKKLYFIASGKLYNEHIYDAGGGPADDAYSDVSSNARLLYKISDSTNIQLSYYNDDYTTYGILIHDNNKSIQTGYDYLQDVRLTFNNAYSFNKFTSGIEYLPEQLSSNGIFVPKGIYNSHESVLFSQDDIKLNNTFSALIGFRATAHTGYGTNFVPKFAIMAKRDNLIYRLSYGFGYRSPTLKEMYYNFDHTFGGLDFYLRGNPKLKPEKSQYIGYSVELNESWVNHSVNIYYNRVQDLITDNWSVINGKNTDTYTNDSSATIIGIDFMEKVMPIRKMTISGGISLVDARNSATGSHLSSISPVSANFSFKYSFNLFGQNTSYDFSGKYNGFRTYVPIAIPGETAQTYQDNPYSLWKTSITQIYKTKYSLTIGVDNIFNAVNPKSFDNLSPGRRYFFSLNIHLTKY